MLDISFSLEGEGVVHRRLDIAAEGVKDFHQPLDQIGRNFLKVFDANFDSLGGAYGGWQPRKPQMVGSTRIDTWLLMEKTGRMRHAFTKAVSATSLKLGNGAPYFVYHQSNKPRKRLPRRVMMKIREQDAQMIVKEFQYYLIGLLRAEGKR